ncbi:MAG: HNH endonuclease [Verrucomicrobiales bacterium]|nr:HNH endonuclease [Verrucomicrobiales bacterium]
MAGLVGVETPGALKPAEGKGMETNFPEKRHVTLPNGRAPSVRRFCRRVRTERGNFCENCGVGPEVRQIESHHILTYHDYPEFGKDPANILVLCINCHRGLSVPYGHKLDYEVLYWARLKPELRQRVADYVEAKDPSRSTFVRIVRAGEKAAEDYIFRDM